MRYGTHEHEFIPCEQTYINIHTLMYMQTPAYSHIHTYISTYIHTCTYTYVHDPYTHMQAHKHTHYTHLASSALFLSISNLLISSRLLTPAPKAERE